MIERVLYRDGLAPKRNDGRGTARLSRRRLTLLALDKSADNPGAVALHKCFGALAWTSPLDVTRRLKFLTRFLVTTTGMGVPSGRDTEIVNCCVKSGPSDWGRAGMSTVRHAGPLRGCEINNAQRRQVRCRCRASASRSCQSAWRACSGILASCWHRRGRRVPWRRPSRRRAR